MSLLLIVSVFIIAFGVTMNHFLRLECRKKLRNVQPMSADKAKISAENDFVDVFALALAVYIGPIITTLIIYMEWRDIDPATQTVWDIILGFVFMLVVLGTSIVFLIIPMTANAQNLIEINRYVKSLSQDDQTEENNDRHQLFISSKEWIKKLYDFNLCPLFVLKENNIKNQTFGVLG